MNDDKEVTQLLQAYQNGENVLEQLLPLVYNELKQIAQKIRFKYSNNETLNTTALVHEAYMKLIGPGKQYENKNHFMAVAAKAMRHVLINHAQKKLTQKREGSKDLVDLHDNIYISEENSDQLIKLEEALQQLEKIDKKQVQIVECRFFAGMSIEDTAEALETSASTVKRNWNVAKVMLYQYLKSG